MVMEKKRKSRTGAWLGSVLNSYRRRCHFHVRAWEREPIDRHPRGYRGEAHVGAAAVVAVLTASRLWWRVLKYIGIVQGRVDLLRT